MEHKKAQAVQTMHRQDSASAKQKQAKGLKDVNTTVLALFNLIDQKRGAKAYLGFARKLKLQLKHNLWYWNFGANSENGIVGVRTIDIPNLITLANEYMKHQF